MRERARYFPDYLQRKRKSWTAWRGDSHTKPRAPFAGQDAPLGWLIQRRAPEGRVLTRQRGLSLGAATYTGDLLLQTSLSEPVFEPDLSEFRVVFRNKRSLTQTRSGIKRIRIGDNLTRFTECAEVTANEFIETELLRASNLNYAVHRCSD